MPKVLCDPDPDAQRRMLEWMAARISAVPIEYYQHPLCFGLVSEAPPRLLGVVCFHDLRRDPSTGEALMVEMSGAGSPGWLSPRTLKWLFAYVFGQLGVRRLNTVTPASNVAALEVDRKMGFQIEGVMRKALPNGDALVIMGMLREECRWLSRETRYGEKGRQQRSRDT